MAKKMKTKMKTKAVVKKSKKKISKTPPIPKDLKPFVIKKFRSKDRTKRIVVVRLPKDEGYNVQIVAKGMPTAVRAFSIPRSSEIPTPIWLASQREMAKWYAGHISRNSTPPSTRKEKSRRKRYMKRATEAYNEHLATKQAVRVMKGVAKPSQPLPKPRMLMPWIMLYDPKECLSDPGVPRTPFRVHTAYCNRLDFERRKAIRDRGGDSWVIEAPQASDAVALQVKEFDEDQMGYDASDFTIHRCAQDRKIVTSKTTLGRVSNKRRA